MNIGIIQRPLPRLEVLKGWDPQSPNNFSQRYPVSEGEEIQSGQLISVWNNPTTNRPEWVVGVDTSAGGRNQPVNTICYWAHKDYTDEDVISAGQLPGFSSQGTYEMQSPFYKKGETYTIDTELTYDGATGAVKPRGTGEPLVATCSRYADLFDCVSQNSSVTPDANGKSLVVTFSTQWIPVNP